MLSTPSLQLFPGPLSPRVVVIVRSASMDKIDLFENYSYLKEILEIIYLYYHCKLLSLVNKME